VLPLAQAQEAIQENPELAQTLMNGFSREVHELLVHLSSLGKTNTKGKLIAALKFLQVCHASQRRTGWWRINFSVNHQLLADLSGITRESAAMVMKDLQTKKVVRHPRLTILEINREHLLELGT
jgi:CRP-like cAMP-binding protein